MMKKLVLLAVCALSMVAGLRAMGNTREYKKNYLAALEAQVPQEIAKYENFTGHQGIKYRLGHIVKNRLQQIQALKQDLGLAPSSSRDKRLRELQRALVPSDDMMKQAGGY